MVFPSIVSLSIIFILSFNSRASSAVQVQIPLGTRSEGITHFAGSNFLFSDAFTGDLYLFDKSSQLITRVVRAPPGRNSFGISATKKYLYAAGGGGRTGGQFFPSPPSALYVYDTQRGTPVAACTPPSAGLINDVHANDDFAYYTDSSRPIVYQLNVSALPNCDVKNIPLPESFSGDGFRANGIVIYNEGLIVCESDSDTIYFIDLLKGNKATKLLPSGSLIGNDGLEIIYDVKSKRRLLFVAQNAINTISVWKLSMEKGRTVQVTPVKNITRPKQFASPTTVAVSHGRLVVANFNFSSPFAIPVTQPFFITSIPLAI